MKKIIAILLLVFVLGGCGILRSDKGIPITGINTGDVPGACNFNVAFLFEFRGVSIFRFYDKSEWRYFSIGDGKFVPQIQSRTEQVGETSETIYWIDGVEK
jgi:hypothetical protein